MRRLPALSALGVLGVVAAAAAAGGIAGPSRSEPVRAGFETVDPGSASGNGGRVPGARGGGGVDGGSPAPTTVPVSDHTVPVLEPVATVPRPGVLPGFDHRAFDAALADRLLAQGAQAVGIAVAKDGHLIHQSAYGVADPATGEPVTTDHRFRVASNSKVITAATVLALVSDGRLGLDEPVLAPLAEQFGVELGDSRMQQVTPRQLMDHSAGFDDFKAEFFRGQAVGCEDVAVEALQGALIFTPGSGANYSNANYCILGLVIEHVVGAGYEQAVTDWLLTPLGITGMRITGNDDLRPGEVVHPGGEERNFMEVLGGAGAWVATPAELLRIVDSLDTDRPGWHPFDASVGAAQKTAGPQFGPNPAHWFGLGLRMWSDGTWGHTGTIQNAHSMVLHQPDGYSWAVLVSGAVPAETDDLKSYVARAFASIEVPDGPVQVPPPVTVGPTSRDGARPEPATSATSPPAGPVPPKF